MVNGPPRSVRGPRQSDRRAAAEGPSDRELLQRFAETRDQDAFAVLVARYGPLVLGVCKRVLLDPEDAEDAFQAVFLVLARKAGTLERPELLANWLYGVAYRAALRVRGRSARRKAREKQVQTMPDVEAKDGSAGREVLAILDEELNHLPERYRILLVLCYLEGKTHEEAARSAGCPLGSLAWRLGRARDLLRKRLARRGVDSGAGLGALLLFAHASHPASLPGRLAASTARAAVGYAAGRAAGVARRTAALADKLLRTLSRKAWGRRALKSSLAALLALAAAALLAYQVWGGGLSGGDAAASGKEPTPAGGCRCP